MDVPTYSYPALLPPGVHLVELFGVHRSENPFRLSGEVFEFMFSNAKNECAWRMTSCKLKERNSLHRTLCELGGESFPPTTRIKPERFVGQIFEIQTEHRTPWGINIVRIRPAMRNGERVVRLPGARAAKRK